MEVARDRDAADVEKADSQKWVAKLRLFLIPVGLVLISFVVFGPDGIYQQLAEWPDSAPNPPGKFSSKTNYVNQTASAAEVLAGHRARDLACARLALQGQWARTQNKTWRWVWHPWQRDQTSVVAAAPGAGAGTGTGTAPQEVGASSPLVKSCGFRFRNSSEFVDVFRRFPRVVFVGDSNSRLLYANVVCLATDGALCPTNLNGPLPLAVNASDVTFQYVRITFARTLVPYLQRLARPPQNPADNARPMLVIANVGQWDAAFGLSDGSHGLDPDFRTDYYPRAAGAIRDALLLLERRACRGGARPVVIWQTLHHIHPVLYRDTRPERAYPNRARNCERWHKALDDTGLLELSQQGPLYGLDFWEWSKMRVDQRRDGGRDPFHSSDPMYQFAAQLLASSLSFLQPAYLPCQNPADPPTTR